MRLHCAARGSFLLRNTELVDLPFIFYMSRVGVKVTGNSPIYLNVEIRKVQPVFEKFFSKWFLTYRTDVRIITEQSKTKMSLGRDLGAAAVSRDRSEIILRDR